MFTGADLSRRSSENSLELPSRHYIKTAKPSNHGNVLETGRGASPMMVYHLSLVLALETMKLDSDSLPYVAFQQTTPITWFSLSVMSIVVLDLHLCYSVTSSCLLQEKAIFVSDCLKDVCPPIQ